MLVNMKAIEMLAERVVGLIPRDLSWVKWIAEKTSMGFRMGLLSTNSKQARMRKKKYSRQEKDTPGSRLSL